MESPLLDPACAGTETSRSIQQAERRRIARLLHDTVAQSLTGTYLQATVIAQKLQHNGSEATDDMARLVDMLHQVILEVQAITQRLSAEEGKPSGSVENL